MDETTLFNGIEHVTIAAKDPKALATWYRDTFGFRIAHESTKSLTTFVGLGGSLVEIIEATNVERLPCGEKDPGLRHLAISVTDIHKAYENLKCKNVAFKSEPMEKDGVWIVLLKDPENNLLHLIERVKSLS